MDIRKNAVRTTSLMQIGHRFFRIGEADHMAVGVMSEMFRQYLTNHPVIFHEENMKLSIEWNYISHWWPLTVRFRRS
jgi:hypothetical protein